MPRKKKDAESEYQAGTIKLDQMNDALVAISNDQRIDNQTVKQMLSEVMLKAYKDEWCQQNGFPPSNAQDLLAQIDIDWQQGTITLYDCKQVVPTDDDIEDDFTQIDLESAKEIDPEIKSGELLRVKVDPASLSKTYIRKVVSYFHQRMKEKAKEILNETYASKIGHNITGVVTHRDDQIGCEINFGQTTGFLSKRDMLTTDQFQPGDTVTVYLIGVVERDGHPTLNVSRTNDGYVRALLTEEVPEIQDGIIKIEASARQPGVRTKIMLSSSRPDIDPVGTCIGEGSVRYRALVASLGKETVDLLEWKDDLELRMLEALKPARIVGLAPDPNSKDRYFAICNNDDKKVAVGRTGSNVRLAGRICRRDISILEVDDAIRQKINYASVGQIVEQARVRAEIEERKRQEEEAQRAAQEALFQEAEPEVTISETPEFESAPVTETPVVEEAPVAPVVEKTPVVQEAPAPAPAVETPAPAPKREEEPVEHVTITGKAKVSLSALEQQVDAERDAKPVSRPNWRKKKKDDRKDEKKDSKVKTATPVQNAMPIYTPEELAELEREEEEDRLYYEDDVEEYDDDSYYDEN